MWAAIDSRNPKGSAGSNAGFVIGDDGVAVIDTFVSADAAKQLLAEIRKLTPQPVRFVINTHYHADHVAGNGVFAKAGAVVLGHRNVRGWIHKENLKLLGPEPKPELKAFIEGLAPPTAGYEQAVDLYLGSREVRVRYFAGHTGGDSVVMIPDANAVFAGDLLWRNSLPNLIDASTQAWIDTLLALEKNEGGATFVPGHGDVSTMQHVAMFREYLTTLRKLVADARAQGKSGESLAGAVMPVIIEKYGQWDFFKYLAPLNVAQTDAELGGSKKIPQPGR